MNKRRKRTLLTPFSKILGQIIGLVPVPFEGSSQVMHINVNEAVWIGSLSSMTVSEVKGLNCMSLKALSYQSGYAGTHIRILSKLFQENCSHDANLHWKAASGQIFLFQRHDLLCFEMAEWQGEGAKMLMRRTRRLLHDIIPWNQICENVPDTPQ